MYTIKIMKSPIISGLFFFFFYNLKKYWSDLSFLLLPNFIPQVRSAPTLRLYTYKKYKVMQKSIKNQSKVIFLKLTTNEHSEKSFLLEPNLSQIKALYSYMPKQNMFFYVIAFLLHKIGENVENSIKLI